MASHLVQAELQRSNAEDVHGMELRENPVCREQRYHDILYID